MPLEEVDLCGHDTLACAHVLYEHLGYARSSINFETKSGTLIVTKTDIGFSMDFPASLPAKLGSSFPLELLSALGDVKPKAILNAFDYIIVLNSEDEVKNLAPDFSKWLTIDFRGLVVTAKGSDVDFVSRCFFPKLRVNEDPVTGSAHCELTPYWASVLNKNTLKARQLSKRSGLVNCELANDRVILTGSVVDYMIGEITI